MTFIWALFPCHTICLTYISKSLISTLVSQTRHVIIRANEHLNLSSLVKSKIKEHFIVCNSCNKKEADSLVNDFAIIKKCLYDNNSKIHEAALIKKKYQSKLNKPLYENDLSFFTTTILIYLCDY